MGKKLNDRYNIFFTIIIVAITSLLILNLYTKDSAFSEGEVTKIYFADNISEAHKIVISMFNEKYSGKIEVVPINLPFTKFNTNERKELLARSLRSKDSRIDIFAVDLIWVPRFAKWAEPLDDYFTEEEISKILPYALSTCYYGKMLVGIPLYLDLGALYYRKDILKNWINYEQLEAKLKNSISWQEFIQIGIQNPDNRPFYIFQGAAYEGLICNFVEVLGGDGGNLINSGIIEVNNSMAIKSCQLMVDLIYKYNISPEFVSTFDENETYRYSLKHDVPFFRCWTSSLKDIHAYPGDSSKIKYLGIAPLPHFEGCNSASTFGGWNLMVSKNSLKKKESLEFLKFILTEEVQITLYKVAGYMPTVKIAYFNEELINNDSYFTYLTKMMKNGIHRPAHEDYTKVSDILSYYLNKAIKNEISVEDALRHASMRINFGDS